MADTRDLYEALGVARDADHETIRKAYRRLARQNHPDLNPGDAKAEERFKEISAAWEVLSDATRRRNYDEFGDVVLDPGFDADAARKARDAFGSRFGAGGPRRASEDAFQFDGIDDLFGHLFSREARGGPGIRMRGADLEASLDLDFMEAARGIEKRLSLNRPHPDGSSATETVTVRIPPGVDSSGRLRIPGKGAAGVGGGPPGDLWVSLHVRPHRVFQRDGQNLTLELPVSIREATLGARIDVPTLDGRATLTIPPGTHSGTRLRLRGKGIAARDGSAGDLLVRVQIRVPRDLDAEAKAAIETLERFEDAAIRKELFS
jgi:DnaJ-class molecular chaperone